MPFEWFFNTVNQKNEQVFGTKANPEKESGVKGCLMATTSQTQPEVPTPSPTAQDGTPDWMQQPNTGTIQPSR